MNIHFYLERKQGKSTEKTIYAYIRGIQPKKTIILNTGDKIDPKFWDRENERAIQRGKNKYINAFDLNNFLDNYEENIKRYIREFYLDNSSGEFEQLKGFILQKFGKLNSVHIGLFDALDRFLVVRKNDLTEGSLRKFKTLKKHLTKYESWRRIKLGFKDFDMFFYDDFRSFLLDEKEMINNSAYKMLGILKIFLNWSHDRGYNKYLEFKKFKLKEDSVDIITLNEDELITMQAYDFAKDKRLSKARDLFLFGCYTGGRFSDLSKIEWADIKDNFWILRTQKTRDIIEIPLIGRALDIISKYKNNDFPLPRISNQKLNKYIKEVAKKVELDEIVRKVSYRGTKKLEVVKPKHELIGTHTARRTFITQSLLRGMKAEIVMKITGHKNFRSFKKYINITSRDVQNEIEKAWNFAKVKS
jgi:integrase